MEILFSLVFLVFSVLCELCVMNVAQMSLEWAGGINIEELGLGLVTDNQCAWPHPPPHGFNYRLCNSGFCRDELGALRPPGTTKITGCTRHFVMSRGEEVTNCSDGLWSHTDYVCLECGRSELESYRIHKGEISSTGDFPWMAGLYMKKQETNKWELSCGGTLISSHLVLTAAHCVKMKSGDTVKSEDLKVGLGKLLTDFYAKESSGIIKDVREIVVPERYIGFALNYALDIALIDLDSEVTTSPEILPACIDWKGSMSLKNGETGYMAGFGFTEHSEKSDVLKWSKQKYINYENCRSNVRPTDIKLVTHDKFCITSVGGARADHGDSGGGLTFVKDDVHYVFGVVSTRLQDAQDTVLFTNLLNVEHRNWLLKHWQRLRSFHNANSKKLEERFKDETGKPCKLEDGKPGLCKRSNDCPSLKEDLKTGKLPPMCALTNDKQAIVCCREVVKDPEVPGAKSKEMCKKYAESVFLSLPYRLGEEDDGYSLLDTCNQPEGKTAANRTATPREFPHMAMIGFGSRDAVLWLCGGSLVSERFVLTAAHCSNTSKGPAKWVRLGDYNWSTKEDDNQGLAQTVEYEIIEKIDHPGYKKPSVYHDLALYKLNTSVQFNEFIRPVCLQTEEHFPHTETLVSGWGRVRWGGKRNEILQTVNASIVSRNVCNNFYERSIKERSNEGILEESMICAGNYFDGSDICQVDGGDPLQVRLEEPYCMYSLVGVLSFGSNDCARFKKPGVYTRISHYISWIEDTIWP